MGAKIIILLSAFLLGLSAAEAKPFKRAVVFSGGGYEFSQFLGVLNALEEFDKKPDLIIASCGGAVAAALAANFESPEHRNQFLKSDRFRGFVRSTSLDKRYNDFSAGLSWLMRRKDEAENHLIPAIYSDYLINVPQEILLPELNISFSETSIPIIIVGSKVLFRPESVSQKIKQKLYTEVYFTSPDIAQYLKNIKSPIALMNADSSINLQTEVITNVGVMQAARAAAANPMIIPPTLINGDYFVGGSVNLYPLELARELADEVIMSFGEAFGDYAGTPVVKAAFQFDANKRLLSVTDQYADWWTDSSDRSSFLENKYGFGIKYGFMGLYFRMPQENDQFDSDIMEQFNYGWDRMLESLFQPTPNFKCHIRNLNSKNSSNELRRSCKI